MTVIYVPKGMTDLTSLSIANTDSLVFAEGTQTIAGGLNLSGLAEGLVRISVHAAFAGNIGSAAAGPLRADLDSGVGKIVYGAGGGSFYYRPEGDDNLCNEIEVLGSGTLYLLGGGTVTELQVGSGRAMITGDVAVTNLRMSGGKVEQKYSATANTIWWIEGGEVHTGRGFSGTAHVQGGARVTVQREDTSGTLPTGATLNIGADSYVKWLGGNITTVNIFGGGVLDLSEAPNALTVGTLNGTAKTLNECKLTSKFAAVTISATNEYIGQQTAI